MASVHWPYVVYFFTAARDCSSKAHQKIPNFYTSSCFKCSPNKQVLAFQSLPALHTTQNCTQHLLIIDQINSVAIKERPQTAATLQSSLTQRLSIMLLSNIIQTGNPLSDPSLIPLALLLFQVQSPSHCLWKVSCCEGHFPKCKPVKALPK